MATKNSPEPRVTKSLPDYESQPTAQPARSSSLWNAVVAVLTPLASLKLTVVLFVMAIFIVFAGTLAQTEKDIWQVVHDYFRMDLGSFSAALRSALAWIDVRIFFPRSFFPDMDPIPWGYGFWFPSGWLIGFVMFLNLTAAHLIRFRIQGGGKALSAGLVVLAVGVLLAIAVVAAGSQQTATQFRLFTDWPSLRILWLLTQCTMVSVVLLVGSLLIFRQRAGLVVLHAGVGLMMLGELLVGISAVEGQMQIVEGQTVNYVMDTRKIELAIVDTSDQREDDVVVIPQSLLRPGTVVQDPQLPFDVELVEFQINSERRMAGPADQNLATAGTGLKEVAVPLDPVSGIDTSGEVNRSAAYVRLLRKNSDEALGVYLVGLEDWFAGASEKVPVDGKTYDVSLRYKHVYKPYSMHLIDVKQDVYMGTQMARSYASQLRLVDATRNVDRTVKIWMNNPLRFAGETFYQSNYGRDSRTGTEYTGLQVVTNTGWRIPYVSCMMMAVGMLAQFWITLGRYLRRRAEGRIGRQPDKRPESPVDPRGTRREKATGLSAVSRVETKSSRSIAGWAFPLAVVVFGAAWLLSKAYAPAPQVGQLDLDAFGRLPIMFEGRIKPIDTLARNSLRIISDRQVFKDENGETQPAIRWLLDVITNSAAAEKHRVFRIQSLEVLDTLGLERRRGFRYAIEEFAPKLDVFGEQVRQARMTDPARRGLYEKKILELEQKFNHYIMLRESFQPSPLRAESLSEDLAQEANRREQNSNNTMPLAVPPKDPDGDWQPYSYAAFDALAQSMAANQGVQVDEPNMATITLAGIINAYGNTSSDATAFNRGVQTYWGYLREHPPRHWNPTVTDFEASFHHFSPFYYAMMLYMCAFLLGCFSWLGWQVPLRRAATWLTVFTLVVHTLALVGRIYISGRPPITNLYSSALFVGWAGVVLAVILEFYSRIGVANVVGAFLGFTTLLISVLMTTAVPSFKGDSFTVLVAVLDTQFWLATHVTCVTTGYSATLFAGLLGIMYVVRGVLTPSQDAALAKETARMIYGTVCFAIFFSFFGTVLGGLWADDSWGRFWGWDPKENGALIIVLWNAVVLHAYWGRMVSQRGLAVLAIVGNIVTAWSWFGVNELGVGLHTYGFTDGVLMILGLVVAGHLLIIALGLVPERWWWSQVRATRGTSS
jgi:ABC-type transport system involved in cytochrome c biogenesis permease subunit